nr:hypothetical protein [uncultured Actinotalea sp.]
MHPLTYLTLAIVDRNTLRPGTEVELHRSDRDERWPAVAAQLVATSAPVIGAEEVTLAAVGAGLAVAQCLAHLDGRATARTGTAWEVRVPEVLPRPMTWATHPDCGCTGLPAAPR